MEADKIFDALASGPRRKILANLSRTALTTSELAERFGMTAPSMSRHLSVLENAQLVTSRREGQKVLYEINADNPGVVAIVRDLWRKFFKRSAAVLLTHLVKDEKLSAAEVRHIRDLLEQRTRKKL
jgi:DNA-binding transcriptional ArsR family regulator